MGSRWRLVRWWLLVPSLALVLACLWVLLTAWSAVAGGHPAYVVTLLLGAVLGALGALAAVVPAIPVAGTDGT